MDFIKGEYCTVQGDSAPHQLSFDDTLVKCPAVRWAVTVAALLPSWIGRASHFDVGEM